MRLVLIAVLAGVVVSAPTLAEEVYYCTDPNVAGIVWDKESQHAAAGRFITGFMVVANHLDR